MPSIKSVSNAQKRAPSALPAGICPRGSASETHGATAPVALLSGKPLTQNADPGNSPIPDIGYGKPGPRIGINPARGLNFCETAGAANFGKRVRWLDKFGSTHAPVIRGAASLKVEKRTAASFHLAAARHP
jgi:hypothetical protein